MVRDTTEICLHKGWLEFAVFFKETWFGSWFCLDWFLKNCPIFDTSEEIEQSILYESHLFHSWVTQSAKQLVLCRIDVSIKITEVSCVRSLTYGFLTWAQLSMVASQCLTLVPKPHSSDCRGRFSFWLMNFFTFFFIFP